MKRIQHCWWYRAVLIGLVWVMALPLMGMVGPAMEAKATKTPKPGGSGAPSAYDVIAAVNSVRSANGLAPFQTNGALMAAAQSHSDYQASVGSTTHSGSGGSDVKSRALAAGYGGGADVSVIENIYGGMNASPNQAVTWWQGDSTHLTTLLSTRHTEAGAGAAVANGVVYYTLVVGAVVGGAAPPASGGTTTGGTVPAAPGATAAADNTLLQATTNPDGSIIHEVQEGQTLWTIAAVYKVDIDDLYRINGLYAGALIRPGQKIIIREAGEYDATPAADQARGEGTTTPDADAPTDTPEATSTRRPTRTPNPAALAAAGANTETPAAKPAGGALSDVKVRLPGGVNPLLLIIGVLVVAGAVMLAAGSLMNRSE